MRSRRRRPSRACACRDARCAIPNGHSGLVALVSDPGAVKIRKALERADAIVESAIDKVEADDIKAAAKEAQQDES